MTAPNAPENPPTRAPELRSIAHSIEEPFPVAAEMLLMIADELEEAAR